MSKRKKSSSNNIISIILVVYNDENILAKIINSIEQNMKGYQNYEIIIVDNGSVDKTVSIIKSIKKNNSHVRGVVLSRYYELEIAFAAGLDTCIGDYIITMNIYTDPPQIIQSFLEKLKQGYDIVLTRYKTPFRLYVTVASWYLIKLCNKVLGHDFLTYFNYCTALNRRAVNSLVKIRRKKRYFIYLYQLIGFKKDFILYTPLLNFKNKIKKENFLNMLIRIMDIVISHSFKPLRLTTFLGMIASLLSFAYLIYTFFIAVVQKDIVEGWISTSLIIGTMFLLLFSILTVISEYLIRIMYESRDEPLYFIAEEIDSPIFSRIKDTLNIT